MTIGKPNFFDIDKYCDCIEGMILADEVERAFWMLDNPPAWYRDNPPERLREIKQSLHQAMFTPFDYKKADWEAYEQSKDENLPTPSPDYWHERGEVLAETVRKLNKDGIKPHIMELGPGTHWLRLGLRRRERRFTYEAQSLARVDVRTLGDGPNILVAFELIEHLQNENELYQAYLKFNRKAQYIFISTPLYTYGGGMNVWREQALGHLRAYTPKEFQRVVTAMFEGYDWKHYINNDGTQVLQGERV